MGRKLTAGSAQALRRTPLYQAHVALGARMVPFAGWEMPIQYSGILAEARAVRTRMGMFDVSHMGRIRISGTGAVPLLNHVLTAHVERLAQGHARYSFLLNEEGGVLDDVILYRLGDDRFLLVCNAANRETVLPWLQRWARGFNSLTIHDATAETAMIAVQGPDAVGAAASLSVSPLSSLHPFGVATLSLGGTEVLVSRTGYTGEDGIELTMDAAQGPRVWQQLQDLGATPCGLGARDVLRLESGLRLHGSDMDATTTPLEAGLERFVALDKGPFIGLEALKRQQAQGLKRRLVGFHTLERGIPRHGYRLLAQGREVGAVTSGGYSPTLDRDIGMGYVAVDVSAPGTLLHVDIRGRRTPAEVVPLPFYTRRREQ